MSYEINILSEDSDSEETIEVPQECIESRCKYLLLNPKEGDAYCTRDDDETPVSDIEDCNQWSED